MSKKTHQKELERARAKRDAERAAQRSQRNRLLAVLLIVALGVGAVVLGLLTRDDPGVAVDDPDLVTDPSDGPSDGSGNGIAACEDPSAGAPEVTATVYDAAPTVDVDPAVSYTATMETTCGTIVLALDAELAPVAVGNFIALARDGYYDGVGFHRVIDGFMIQGGDPAGTGCGQPDCAAYDPAAPTFPGYSFDDELALAQQVVAETGGYPRGTLAMANSGANTNGSQFFIVQGRGTDYSEPYPLPAQYVVFGEVLEGLDVVDRIAQGPNNGDSAIDPVRILSITVTEA